eukprot:2213254-Amphidinium_carterae.1
MSFISEGAAARPCVLGEDFASLRVSDVSSGLKSSQWLLTKTSNINNRREHKLTTATVHAEKCRASELVSQEEIGGCLRHAEILSACYCGGVCEEESWQCMSPWLRAWSGAFGAKYPRTVAHKSQHQDYQVFPIPNLSVC